MKAINTIPALFLIVMFAFSFGSASAEGTSRAMASDVVILNAGMLAPSTPAVATFEDVDITTIDFASIAPVTPAVADFSDVVLVNDIDVAGLAPSTPVEADFTDGADAMVDVIALSPATPVFADFD